jgi:hypothetical protein
MTLGNAATALVRLLVWCKACGHQVQPDPAEMAARYGADTLLLEWRGRLVCSECGGGKWKWSSPEPSGDCSPTGATGRNASLALACVLPALVVSRAVVPVVHQEASPECRAAAGCVKTKDNGRRRWPG